MRDRVLIVGTGAMACWFAARLAEQADVLMLGTWTEGLRALQEHGVRLDGGPPERVRASGDPQDFAGVRQALVLVKSWQTPRAARQLAACLAADGVALSLQNGLGNAEALQAALGEGRTAQGVTTTGATLRGPGEVSTGGEGVTHLARLPQLQPLAELLRRSGLAVQFADDLAGLVWGKLAVNAGINALTALLRVTNGELLARPPAASLMVAAAQEAASVAAAQGVALPYEDAGVQAAEVARRTADNRSSMLQDVLRGAPTEVDAINGAVAHLGERLAVATPVNRTLWQLVRALSPGQGGAA